MSTLDRSFGGKLSGFVSKEERKYQRKNLKAYMKGDKFFRYGFDTNRRPNWYLTDEIVNNNKIIGL